MSSQEQLELKSQGQWDFWIDRGGTFTDIVARRPDGSLTTHKLLSENPRHYQDAALQGIRELMGVDSDKPLPCEQIRAVKMGTTVATNALLERKGDATVLVVTRGFADALRIGYQTRPRLFDLNIQLPEMLYSRVIEVDERLSAEGVVLRALDAGQLREDLEAAYDKGFRSVAICLMHGYRFPDHEKLVAALAGEVGFSQVSVSNDVSPLMKFVSRGDTTVVDAYLTPLLRRYVSQVAAELGDTRLMFMQSHGGLTDASFFQGKDAVLSGPAGGVVSMVETAEQAGFKQVIGFDMGGTSTDVSHFDGEYERTFESEVAGVRMRAPMMLIHTVAAGGGSILHFDGSRFRVGPDSAGADPGPACYRKGGPLTVTDCNLMLGRIQPEFFPRVFGSNADETIDVQVVRDKFSQLAEQIYRKTGDRPAPESVAEGFLAIAVENMANAIKRISVQRGHDLTDYVLNCFGGAGGQHACRVADSLGMKWVLLHPYAGVLSAYGIGLADVRLIRQQAVEETLGAGLVDRLENVLDQLAGEGRREMQQQQVAPERIRNERRLLVRYAGSDTALVVAFGGQEAIERQFAAAHHRQFGFSSPDKALIVDSALVEVVGSSDIPREIVEESPSPRQTNEIPVVDAVSVVMDGEYRQAPVYRRNGFRPGERVRGPAIISEANGTLVVEPGWEARVDDHLQLILHRVEPLSERKAIGTDVDPVMLEIFNNLFMSIAEQMGAVLENTAVSVNIKERLDFSCALFNRHGDLVANAPHVPVHLGSMSESIKAVINRHRSSMREGDAYMLNDPYNGGTHLPDVTVIKPVFLAGDVQFYVATRGHHADIGGVTPGSMPPMSRDVSQEGILIDNIQVVDQGRFLEEKVRELLSEGLYPARNIDQNMADFQAQLAACEKGVIEICRMVEHFGLDVVRAYMQHVQDNAEEAVRRVLVALHDGAFRCEMDDGSVVAVQISLDREGRCARVDFTGTSPQHRGNFNAPSAVCKAAVLYVFRTLVGDDIPLNGGCLKPLEIIIPEGSMLSPQYPAAVVAGNVETSQAIVDALYGALGTMAASQGTMNNFTFGNVRYQYYETLCGGAGAGPDFDGADAVHTHMTNSRLTDPEVLEWRFPVLLESFAIRRGSGGEGAHCGGDGVIRRLRFLQGMSAAILANRRKVQPYGMAGGKPGAFACNWVEREDGSVEELGSQAEISMNAGDAIVIETPGGGGYGNVDIKTRL